MPPQKSIAFRQMIKGTVETVEEKKNFLEVGIIYILSIFGEANRKKWQGSVYDSLIHVHFHEIAIK